DGENFPDVGRIERRHAQRAVSRIFDKSDLEEARERLANGGAADSQSTRELLDDHRLASGELVIDDRIPQADEHALAQARGTFQRREHWLGTHAAGPPSLPARCRLMGATSYM